MDNNIVTGIPQKPVLIVVFFEFRLILCPVCWHCFVIVFRWSRTSAIGLNGVPATMRLSEPELVSPFYELKDNELSIVLGVPDTVLLTDSIGS